MRLYVGRSGELVEQILTFANGPESSSAWRAAAAVTLIDSGRADEARELALAEDFQSVPWDWVWSVTVSAWADVCSRLGLVDRAGELYGLLKPFSVQLAVAGCYVSGSTDWALGTLAATLERHEQAEDHFAAAAEIEERFGAPLFLARTRASWARALIARGRSEDLDRAQLMLEQAEDAARRLGAEGITREVADCRAALAAICG
jgi:tetratricopeptide (TPR) repeat protein